MSIVLSVRLVDPVPPGNPLLLAPRPLAGIGHAFDRLEVEYAAIQGEIQASNAPQGAFLLRATDPPSRPVLRYVLRPDPAPPPDWVWSAPDTRYARATPELAAFAREAADATPSPAAALRRIVDHASEIMWYGHGPDTVIGDGAAVPLLTRPTRGTCIDMHGYCLAAARAAGIEAAYCAGFWFGAGENRALGMHCWFAARVDGAIVHYDVSRQLKIPRRPIVEGLEPMPGRRVLMACGKGLEFDLPGGTVRVDHFARFVWRTPDGRDHYPAYEVTLESP
ncbi:MAG: hypothetical protein ING19_18080 [Azospirillum sp.]|nr:hypothetical protein [Azospirillum sp.]MCA3267975.1 hypothetical protein [Azospirillum sp.]